VLPLLLDAETGDDALPLPQQGTQRQGSTGKARQKQKQKQKQKPTWRGADNVTWDPHPSAVRFVLPLLAINALVSKFQDQLTRHTQKLRNDGDRVVYVDPSDGRRGYEVIVAAHRFDNETRQMQYTLRTLGGVRFEEGGEWVDGERLRDRRPALLQQQPQGQAGPSTGSGSGSNRPPEHEPETGTELGTGTKKPSSIKRAVNSIRRCIPWP
jgi:hypothetical protein